jgi:hypothetical protein
MNTIPVLKYYKMATLLPFAGTIIGGIAVVMLHDDKELQNTAIGDDNFGQTIFLMVVFSFTISVLSASIFLSRYKPVINNFFIHLLSWMLLPLGCLGVMLYNQVNFLMEYLFDGWEHPAGETEMQVLFVSVLVAHLLAIVISFIKFRKAMQVQDKQPAAEIKQQRPVPRPTHTTPLTHHR